MSSCQRRGASSGTDIITLATTQYGFDDLGRLCRVVENATGGTDLDALANPCASALQGTSTATQNVSTTYTYDGAGNLATMVDARGKTTTYAYDPNGQLTGLTDPNNQTVSWSYDNLGRRTGQTNRQGGATVTWTYDGAGRMLTRLADNLTVTSTYDDNGNRLTAGDGTRTITTTYDRLNRPLTVTLSDDASATTSYTYSLTSPQWTDPTGTYLVTLDTFDRQVSLRDPIHGTNAFTTTYRADGQPSAMAAPNGNTTALTYDSLGRALTKVTTGTGGAARASYTWTWNRAGQSLTDESIVTGDPTNGTTTYTYDPLERLTGFTRSGTTTAYGWDTVPNRTSLQVGANPAVTTSYDDADRPLSDSGGGTYASDLDGRLTLLAGKTLVWDSLGRLTQVKNGATPIAVYSYDPLDRLRLVDYGANNRIRFRYVGLTTAVAQTVDDQSGAVIRSIATDWTGQRLADWTGTNSNQRFYGTNGHHDVTWTASDTGAVSATLRYDPWGTLTSSTGSSLPDLRFQFSWYDPATDLSWVISRWYAPALGRFVSEDSLLGEPADPPSRHLYAYGAGEPVGRWDPDGQYWYRVKTNRTWYSLGSRLGNPSRWPMIWNANKNRFAQPSSGTIIREGTCLWIPSEWLVNKNLREFWTRPGEYCGPYRHLSTGKFTLKGNVTPEKLVKAQVASGLGGREGLFNFTRRSLYALTDSTSGNRPRNPTKYQWEGIRQRVGLLNLLAATFALWPAKVNTDFGRLWIVYGRTAPTWCGRNLCTLGEYIFTNGNSMSTAQLAHEYVHVLQYEGRGFAFAVSYINDLRDCHGCSDPSNHSEAPAYIWEAWIENSGGVELMPWKVWKRPPR